MYLLTMYLPSQVRQIHKFFLIFMSVRSYRQHIAVHFCPVQSKNRICQINHPKVECLINNHLQNYPSLYNTRQDGNRFVQKILSSILSQFKPLFFQSFLYKCQSVRKHCINRQSKMKYPEDIMNQDLLQFFQNIVDMQPRWMLLKSSNDHKDFEYLKDYMLLYQNLPFLYQRFEVHNHKMFGIIIINLGLIGQLSKQKLLRKKMKFISQS